jgi:hypothetical protein
VSSINYFEIIQDTTVIVTNSGVIDSSKKDSNTTIAANPLKLKSVKKVEVKKDEGPILPNFFFTSYSKDFKVKLRSYEADSWMLPLLLFAVFFLGIINTYFFKETRQIFSSIFKKGSFKKLLNEENVMIRRTILLFVLLFLIVTPIFSFQAYTFFNGRLDYIPLVPPYIQILLILSASFGLKVFGIRFLGYIFSCGSLAMSYISGILICFIIAGLLLIPIALFIKISVPEVSEPLVYAGVALLSGTYIVSLFSGIINAWREEKLSKFHLILYFCTLETLPVFIIIKTVSDLA